jgi:hypothetical protein
MQSNKMQSNKMTLSEELFAKINEYDKQDAPDVAYRNIFSTGAKTQLRRNETWRQKAISWATKELKVELEELEIKSLDTAHVTD